MTMTDVKIQVPDGMAAYVIANDERSELIGGTDTKIGEDLRNVGTLPKPRSISCVGGTFL